MYAFVLIWFPTTNICRIDLKYVMVMEHRKSTGCKIVIVIVSYHSANFFATVGSDVDRAPSPRECRIESTVHNLRSSRGRLV